MSNWIAFICPTGAHATMLLSFITLLFFAVPTPDQPISLLQRRDYAIGICKKFASEAGKFAVNVLLPLAFQWLEHARDFISSSLPDAEETAFEEQFKYLIVSSSLLSELPTPSTTPPNTRTTSRITSQNSQFFTSIVSGMLAVAAATSFLLLAVSYFGVLPHYFSLGCLILATHGLAFFVFRRQYRRTKIRGIHQAALGQLRQFVAQCEQGDTAGLRLIDQIRQLDVISQGSTLAPPSMTPTATPASSRLAADMRRAACHILHSQFRNFSDALSNLEPLSHGGNLSRFRDMYNINAVPSQLLRFDDRMLRAAIDTTDELEHLMHIIHWKRREYVIHLLALDVMTLGHDSERVDYEQIWESVIKVISELVATYRRHIPSLHEHLTSSSLCSEDEEERKVPGTDQRSQALLHQYTALEKHVRSIQSKLLLCRQDTKAISASRAATTYSMDRIGERFGSIDQDISHMLAQWEEAKDAYLIITDNDSCEDLSQTLPSPPSSPRKTDSSSSSSGTPRRAQYRKSMMSNAAGSSILENKRASRQQRTRAQLHRYSLLSSPSTETL